MGSENNRITELTYKYQSGEITPEELAVLWAYLNGEQGRLERFEKRVDASQIKQKILTIMEWELAKQKSRERTLRAVAREEIVSYRIWPRLVSAACVLIAFAGLVIYRLDGKMDKRPTIPPAATANIRPGGNRATLRLGNGSVITLDSASNGTIARQGKTVIEKKANGNIAYDGSSTATNVMAMINTITTPRGGEYQVTLPDGTKAWLNAASSITFPTSFTGGKREVEVVGEVYFEVAKDVGRPFVVRAGDRSIAVLGTSFDVTNYIDEPFKATLLSGAVKVAEGNQSLLLKPGNQAKADGQYLHLVTSADTAAIVAWKQGDFRFRGESIEAVMRQLSRWYNIDVIFVGDRPAQTLTAVVSRNMPVSDVLTALAVSGYHFKIDKDRIEIMP